MGTSKAADDLGPVEDPVVTVVVCVHNGWDLTSRALDALARSKQFNTTAFEVLVVDDASTDETAANLDGIAGVRVLHLPVNQRFLRAANAGIAAADGRHVLLLNNDTEVVGNWLDPLVESLRRHPAAGVVGSRLVYPDGTLQEAGGIIFSDATGWNYGRGWRFDDPRATFERQVDYCSGASLLLADRLLDKAHGFDELFVPAYYEDTDLCFTARELGLEVWYQPRSIVVHVEGGSHGRSQQSGLKAYQRTNRVTFADKWEVRLREQHTAHPDVVEVARSRERHRIVIIDNEVPTPDRDSGSRRLVAIIEILRSMGYAVTFLPHNGMRPQPYTGRLEQLGVEVLGDPFSWSEHLASLAAHVSLVWLARPHVAEDLLPSIRRWLPGVPVLYDTVDLHFLREERRAAVTGSRKAAISAAMLRRRELGLVDQTDITAVVSPAERDILAGLSSAEVVVVGNVHAPDPPLEQVGDRTDVLFVGGFRHLPNIDAVRWFTAEIWPAIHDRIRDARMRVVGADMPVDLLAEPIPGVDLVGWLPDLQEAYARARVVVAPLRYGAGVKGKVGEAMGHGVPVVLTTVAAEGMGLGDGIDAAITDSPSEFADAVVTLFEDDDLWLRRSKAGTAALAEALSPQAVRTVLTDMMARLARSGPYDVAVTDRWIIGKARSRRARRALSRVGNAPRALRRRVRGALDELAKPS